MRKTTGIVMRATCLLAVAAAMVLGGCQKKPSEAKAAAPGEDKRSNWTQPQIRILTQAQVGTGKEVVVEVQAMSQEDSQVDPEWDDVGVSFGKKGAARKDKLIVMHDPIALPKGQWVSLGKVDLGTHDNGAYTTCGFIRVKKGVKKGSDKATPLMDVNVGPAPSPTKKPVNKTKGK